MPAKPTIAAAVLLIALVACAGDDPTVVATSTGDATGPEPSGLPTGSPISSVTLATGTAQVTTSGELETTTSVDALSSPAIYEPLPGDVAVGWAGLLLVITGPLHLGAQATIGGLTLSLSVPTDGPPASFASSAGECIVTVDAADDRSFSGSFTCGGLTSGDVIVDAEGTFAASA